MHQKVAVSKESEHQMHEPVAISMEWRKENLRSLSHHVSGTPTDCRSSGMHELSGLT